MKNDNKNNSNDEKIMNGKLIFDYETTFSNK